MRIANSLDPDETPRFVAAAKMDKRMLVTSSIYYLIGLQIFTAITVSHAAPCTSPKIIGESNPNSATSQGRTGVSYINCGNGNDGWLFDCCGSTTKFTFYAAIAGSITLHIWRPKTGSVYTLVGSITHTATAGGTNTVPAVFSTEAGDCIGW
ncbi:hypothetical protein DPMN_095400 [Dreissena polymorpha]|uniref:Uncharacterized protein n=1 Tax=Dreissena polymorpha TaxID=45954 RepID=A0A9D4L7T6_DREPO|nr:hypothetical protein DPMN_095400 [Dreissena polymorpha]